MLLHLIRRSTQLCVSRQACSRHQIQDKKVIVNFAIDPHTVMFQQSGDGLDVRESGASYGLTEKTKTSP